MSIITVKPFQFTKRTNAVNINQDEINDFNSKLELLSERYDCDFATTKDLFTFLLDLAVNETDFSEKPNGIELKEGEIVIQASEIDNLKNEHATTVAGLQERITGFETDEKERFAKQLSESQAMENVLLVPVTPEQKELLEIIATNRMEENYETDLNGIPDTPDSIIRKIAFRDCYLRNEYKRFYTGL